MAVSLPILTLPLGGQSYSCHGCGGCCREFTVQLDDADLRRLTEQRWAERLGEPVTVEFRGRTFLRQRESDGGCIFLLDDGRCRVHAEFGFTEKPVACQLFPFSLVPAEGEIRMGLNFGCPSVVDSKGAALSSHLGELRRMGRVMGLEPASVSARLTRSLRAQKHEVDLVADAVDGWLATPDVSFDLRLEGLAWLATSLARATLDRVRGSRLRELMDLLTSALPEELHLLPDVPATARQCRVLRQSVFARVEHPTINAMRRTGRLRTSLAQLGRQRAFARGRGAAPFTEPGWPDGIDMSAVDAVAPASDRATVAAVDDVMTRYMRATIRGGRAWGAGYYGWPIVDGLEAMVLTVGCLGWLARLHACGSDRRELALDDVRAALICIDRHVGRAPWLGSRIERMRLSYLRSNDGLRRLARRYTVIIRGAE